jgi:hypothetical protein
LSLNLGSIGPGVITGIEQIDLRAAGTNTLTITAQQLRDLSDTSDTLTVFGDNTDTVSARGFTAAGTRTVGGVTFNVYTGTGGGELLVQQGVFVNSQVSAIHQLVF